MRYGSVEWRQSPPRSRRLPHNSLRPNRDTSAEPMRSRQMGVGCGGRRNTLLRRGQKWRDAALPEIDRQEHQFLHRNAICAGDAEHLVRQVQALAIRGDDLARDAEPLASQHLSLIEIV